MKNKFGQFAASIVFAAAFAGTALAADGSMVNGNYYPLDPAVCGWQAQGFRGEVVLASIGNTSPCGQYVTADFTCADGSNTCVLNPGRSSANTCSSLNIVILENGNFIMQNPCRPELGSDVYNRR